MSNIHDNSWLNPLLVNNTFPWDQATPTTFPDLLRRVSFHDGYWHGCFPSLDDNSAVLVLQPDTIWNLEFCHRQEPWPYLVIEVRRALSVLQDAPPNDVATNTISTAESAAVDAARLQEWLEFAKVYDLLPVNFFDYQKLAPPLHRTDIYVLLTGALSIIHEAPIRLLLYTATGEQLPVRLSEVKG